jgi:H+/Cl- antiporter ClcA
MEKSSARNGGLLSEVASLARSRIRDYAMFIALAVIFIVFGIFTGGSFLSPRNLTNLINQTGYIAVLAVGMTLVLIISQIDNGLVPVDNPAFNDFMTKIDVFINGQVRNQRKLLSNNSYTGCFAVTY